MQYKHKTTSMSKDRSYFKDKLLKSNINNVKYAHYALYFITVLVGFIAINSKESPYGLAKYRMIPIIIPSLATLLFAIISIYSSLNPTKAFRIGFILGWLLVGCFLFVTGILKVGVITMILLVSAILMLPKGIEGHEYLERNNTDLEKEDI